MTQATLRDLVLRIASAEPGTLSHWMVSNDRYARRLCGSEIDVLAASALADGELAATAVQIAHSPEGIAALASELGISVIEVDGEIDVAGHVFSADYRPNPPRIRLYTRALAAIDRGLADPRIAEIIGATRALPVLLAHEIYHHLDFVRPTTLTQRHRVTSLRLGPLHLKTELPSLAEVAAGRFAAALLGLRCHPKVLDLLLLWDGNPQRAEAWVEACGAFVPRLLQKDAI